MKLALKLVVVALVLLIAAWLVFAWFESEKELRVLCIQFHVGLEREYVVHVLDTGDFLRYRILEKSTGAGGEDDAMIVADSFYGLGTTRCVIELEAGRVVSSAYE